MTDTKTLDCFEEEEWWCPNCEGYVGFELMEECMCGSICLPCLVHSHTSERCESLGGFEGFYIPERVEKLSRTVQPQFFTSDEIVTRETPMPNSRLRWFRDDPGVASRIKSILPKGLISGRNIEVDHSCLMWDQSRPWMKVSSNLKRKDIVALSVELGMRQEDCGENRLFILNKVENGQLVKVVIPRVKLAQVFFTEKNMTSLTTGFFIS